jgi:hypothetical protein
MGRPLRSSSPTAALLEAMGLAPALEGDDAPAVPATRRITSDGREILVDLATAPFGAGHHACPGQALALHLADAKQP